MIHITSVSNALYPPTENIYFLPPAEEIGVFCFFLLFESYNKGDAVALLPGKPDLEADLAPKCIRSPC